MKKIILYTFMLSIFFISCVSAPVNNSNRFGTYNGGTVNASQDTETELVFTFNGPQGVSARLYYNGQLIGTSEPEKILIKTIPNNEHNFMLRAQIGNESRELKLSARGSTTINVNITARRTPSGIVITTFNIVNRTPLYDVKYVNAGGLNVRSDLYANAAILDVIPKDCRVEILEEDGSDWVRIKYYGTKAGCVNGTYLTSTQPPLIITSLKVGNYNNGIWLTNAGNPLYSSQMRFLFPVITYDATFSGQITFFVKIIHPNGSVARGKDSPNGFTYKEEYQVNSGNNQTLTLLGWGYNGSSIYEAGNWTVEIWYNNRRLWSEIVNIRP